MNPLAVAYLFLGIAIGFEVAATTLLQTTEQFSKLIPSLLTIGCYGASFFCLAMALRTMPIGLAYAIWSGLGIVLVSFLGWVLFKQSLDLAAIIGIGFIIAGVLIINLFSNSLTH